MLKIRGSIQIPLIIATSLLLGSCAEYRTITVQTLVPPEISIPNNFNQPLVVVSLYRSPSDDPESMAAAALDSTAGVEAINVLANALSQSPFFQDVSIPTSIYFRTDGSRYILPFDWDTVEMICAPKGADLLISLEYVKIKQKSTTYSYWQNNMQMYYGELRLIYFTYWRMYDLNSRKVIGNRLLRDTLLWQETDFSPVRVGDQLPGFFASAAYCGYLAGTDYSKLIAAAWADEQRLLFRAGSSEMRRAAKLVMDNNWLDAAQQWQRVLSNPRSSQALKARAAFNMALANEIRGNFDVALEWLSQSLEYMQIPEQNWYRDVIEERIASFKKFDGMGE